MIATTATTQLADDVMTTVACNLCGSSRERLITVQSAYRVVRCAGCGFVYVNPRPDEATLERLYLKYLPDKMIDPLSWDSYMNEVFSKAASYLSARLPDNATLLDVGCGYGFFLSCMKAKATSRVKVSGIDVSKTAVSYAAGRGLDVQLGTLDTIKFADNSFDAITMFYVLEHIPDPTRALKEARRILKPGGALFLRLPHTTPIVRILSLCGIKNNLYDPPFHLNDFSAETIGRMLTKAGFENVHTFIGGTTSPPGAMTRVMTKTFGLVAETLYLMSFKRFTLPGVAKNTIAYKGK
ncbi:MAG: class I SAM-dependent methyltransferase [Deltaproteobacteria bacterium]|nr:class I SAM-dependent methyltransferase [Deltaproteobacteria bacterium]